MTLSAINRIWGGFYGSGGAYNVSRTGTTDYTDVLSQIESVGWRLEHVSDVWMITGSQSRDKLFTSGQDVGMTGEMIGIYLFRRV